MKTVRYLASLTLIGMLLSAVTGDLRAGAEVGSEDETNFVVSLEIIEDPDPIPQVIWGPSPDFAGRADGPPHVAYEKGEPVVTWAQDIGSDHDVAYATWNGQSWDSTQFLTFGPADDLDPRAFAGDGLVHVVWWVNGPGQRVLHMIGDKGGWGAPQQVTGLGESGRRPSVVVWNGDTLVTYERDADGAGQQIVLAGPGADGTYSVEVLFTIDREEAAAAVAHAEHGHLWIDWIQSDDELAYSEWTESGWSAPQAAHCGETSWSGVEQTREAIRQIVLMR